MRRPHHLAGFTGDNHAAALALFGRSRAWVLGAGSRTFSTSSATANQAGPPGSTTKSRSTSFNLLRPGAAAVMVRKVRDFAGDEFRRLVDAQA